MVTLLPLLKDDRTKSFLAEHLSSCSRVQMILQTIPGPCLPAPRELWQLWIEARMSTKLPQMSLKLGSVLADSRRTLRTLYLSTNFVSEHFWSLLSKILPNTLVGEAKHHRKEAEEIHCFEKVGTEDGVRVVVSDSDWGIVQLYNR